MDAGETLVARMQMHVARWLVKGPAPQLIVAGTLAFAGFGAATLNAAPDGRDLSPSSGIGITGQSYPSNCHPDPDGDGNLVCQIAVSQVSAYPNADCDTIADASGMVTCWIHPRD